MGIPLDEVTILYTLSFADDKIVVAQDLDDTECMARKLIDDCKILGLEVNVEER